MSNVAGIAGDKLKSFVERIERVREEAEALKRDEREIFAELKGSGFDAKIVRQLLKLRKMDQNERQEQEALLDLYKSAVGMSD